MRVRSVEELVDLVLHARRTTGTEVPSGRGVGVITFGGGNGVLGADQCAQNGLVTPALRPRMRRAVAAAAGARSPPPPIRSISRRPPRFVPKRWRSCRRRSTFSPRKPEIQSLLFIVGSMAAKANEISDVICGLAERARKPVCVSWPSPPRAVPARLADRGIYAFLDPARGIRALAKLGRARCRLAAAVTGGNDSAREVRLAHVRPVEATHAVIPEPTCHRILAAAGLAVAAGELVDDEASAVRAADAIGRPVVLKGITPQVTHRAKAGLVVGRSALGGRRARRLSSVARARGRAVDRARRRPTCRRCTPRGTELIVTAFRDPVFGVMVSCGSGGVLTELDRRRGHRARAGRHRRLPLHMLERLRTRRYAHRRARSHRDGACCAVRRAILRACGDGAVGALRVRGESRAVAPRRRRRAWTGC